MRRLALVAALVAAALLAGSSAQALRLPGGAALSRLPREQRVEPARRHAARRGRTPPQLIASIGLDAPVHADFGSGKWDGGPIGIPFDVVSRATPLHRVSFGYADESDRVRYPIPRHVQIEGGAHATGDRHAILVDKSTCRLYELYDLRHTGRGWTAGSGATWSLRSNHLRPAGWTSADAAGLPIFPGLARWDEVKRGVIDHALRFTAPETRRAYVYPARHFASDSTDPRYRRWGCACG